MNLMRIAPILATAAVAVALVGCESRPQACGKVAHPRLHPAEDAPVAALSAIAALGGEQLTEKREFVKDGYTLRYRFHKPTKIDPNACYPLILFLHGAGERGDDNTATLRHGVVPLCRYAMRHGDAFVVAPQCPNGKKWVDQDWSVNRMTRPAVPTAEMKAVMALLEELRRDPHVNLGRVYVTGISMGGFGTWDIVTRLPGVFAGMMPLCGGVDERTALLYKDEELGIRFCHGGADKTVDSDYSRRMDQALTEIGKKHDYIEYNAVGHDCWTRTYANAENLDWLFGNVRKAITLD